MATITQKSTATRAKAAGDQVDRDVADAYLYLLGRLLVLRQEHLDFGNEGFEWNQVIHRKPGGVAGANPNLDVACSDAWIAVDERSSTLIEIPDIKGRYYTVQLVNPWGETIVNLNDRTYPHHPAGAFLICQRGARVTVPTGTVRIDLPGTKARALIRIALGGDPEGAEILQHRIALDATGTPAIAAAPNTPVFTNEKLPRAEAFENAEAVIASEPDVNPGVEAVQANVRRVAMAVAAGGAQRRHVEHVIKEQAWAALREHVANMGIFANGWVRPRVNGNYGSDYVMRTVANLTGTWANNQTEVVHFGNGSAQPLSGSHAYSMRFATRDLPDLHVKYSWSVICVDATGYRVIPNAKNKFLLNKHSGLQLAGDGSLTLFFAPEKPHDVPEANWLPTPLGKDYLLTWRSYGPDAATLSGKWYPPQLQKM